MLLSPLAPAFKPSMGFDEYDLCIYNNGVPAMYPADLHSESEILEGIGDDALDDYFPPTAEEAAEIEAAEAFVFTMARLDLLEEREEHARADIGSMLPKRWEARREQGLVGKPRPAVERSSSSEGRNTHANKFGTDETRLVPHEHRRKDLALAEYVSREQARAELQRLPTKMPKQKRAHYRMPIQQPNKFV